MDVREALVVPPWRFDVRRSYNTRMNPNRWRPDKALAATQWAAVVETACNKLGIEPRIIDPVPDLDDMTFARDPGFWIDDLFIPARFEHPERQPEVNYFIAWMLQHGYAVYNWKNPEAVFEGGDCVWVDHEKTLVLGYGDQRTDWAAVQELTGVLETRGVNVVPIRRITEDVYHLNSAFAYLFTSETIHYFGNAFVKSAWRMIREYLRNTGWTVWDEEELFRHHPRFDGIRTYSYALNVVEQRGMALMPYCHEKMRSCFRGEEVEVEVFDTSEHETSGGSIACCFLPHNTTR